VHQWTQVFLSFFLLWAYTLLLCATPRRVPVYLGWAIAPFFTSWCDVCSWCPQPPYCSSVLLLLFPFVLPRMMRQTQRSPPAGGPSTTPFSFPRPSEGASGTPLAGAQTPKLLRPAFGAPPTASPASAAAGAGGAAGGGGGGTGGSGGKQQEEGSGASPSLNPKPQQAVQVQAQARAQAGGMYLGQEEALAGREGRVWVHQEGSRLGGSLAR